MRIAIDTNVFVAALTKPGGSSARIVKAWRACRVEVISSEATLREAELVLDAPWLARLSSRREIAALLEELRTLTVQVRAQAISDIQLKDEGDLRLVEAAVAGGADYLVTSDRELLLQRAYGRTEFVTPGELLKAMEKEEATAD